MRYVYAVHMNCTGRVLAMSTSTKEGYHHGDLRAALLSSAMTRLEAGDQFSLRALAREVGVSPAAPYRHFDDREALDSALTAVGLRELTAELVGDGQLPETTEDLAELGVRYVGFALRRPALFRLMFGSACDLDNPERVAAAAEIRSLLELSMRNVFPGADPAPLAAAGWGLAHGLAFLHLEGKLPADSPEQVAEDVRAAFAAIVSINS